MDEIKMLPYRFMAPEVFKLVLLNITSESVYWKVSDVPLPRYLLKLERAYRTVVL